MRRKRPRIAIGPAEIAGYGENLAAGFRKLGVDARCYYASAYAFTPGETNAPFPSRLAQRTHAASVPGKGVPGPVRFLIRLAHKALRAVLLVRIMLTRDHLILLGGGSYLGVWEWRMARWFGCTVTMVYLGSESRPAYLGANIVRKNAEDTGKIRALSAVQKRRVQDTEARVNRVISCDVISHFLRGECWDFFQIGFPRNPEGTPPPAGGTGVSAPGAPVKILHAPSHPVFKGTREWRAMIEELKSEGLSIHYEELSGVPNSEVMKALHQCDLVVDELWADTPLGGLATEAWMCGRPAVVGGYAQRELAHMSAWGAPMECYVRPEETKEMIRKLCTDADFRRQQGKQGQDFILHYYAADKVAERFLRLFDGAPLPQWKRNPAAASYVHGIAFTEESLRCWLRQYVEKEGVAALLLEDKPALLQRFVAFLQEGKVSPETAEAVSVLN